MTIDTLKVARRLREAGFSESQAEAVVEAVRDGAEDADFATKHDLSLFESELRGEMREMEARLKADIETANARTQIRLTGMILGALGVNILAVLGAMFGLAKLLGN
jgi:DNA-binding transcriptional MerR regulator